MTTEKFAGFPDPSQNYYKTPNDWINISATMTASEMRLVQYVLRHTWGFQRKQTRITIDEFQYGRKKKDGSRMDVGAGVGRRSIISGLKSAVEKGFLYIEKVGNDAARMRYFYSIARLSDNFETKNRGAKSAPQGCKKETARVQKGNREGAKSAPRSEKDNTRKTTKKNILGRPAGLRDNSSKTSSNGDTTDLSDYDIHTGKTIKKILIMHGKQLGDRTKRETFSRSIKSLRKKVEEERITKVVKFLEDAYTEEYTPKLHRANDLLVRFDQFEEASLRYYEKKGEDRQDWKTCHKLMTKVRAKMIENGDFDFDDNCHTQKQVDKALKQLRQPPGLFKRTEIM